MVTGEGTINPFAKRSGGLDWADSRSHAVGIVLHLHFGEGGEWYNGSINIRANMALTWANFWDSSTQEFWGQDISVMASENGAVKQYDGIADANSI